MPLRTNSGRFSSYDCLRGSIFCWFLQEKGLIPRRLFRWSQIQELLKNSKPSAGTYYQAILQNLFFATLNREPEKRGFRDKKTTGRFDKNRGITDTLPL